MGVDVRSKNRKEEHVIIDKLARSRDRENVRAHLVATLEQLQFAGTVGVADGLELPRPKSAFVVTFLVSDPSEASVNPTERQFEQMEGLDEYEDAAYAVDGSGVTVRAKTSNERFDGYLPGGPDDRV